ncbi:LPXTG cell wall anchor domain-containing protein, partial [Enterococcus faecalis]|uniref:LPXTG cell wall anchor domain-containing protein n=1 Tax=Enterococcus faecalis TaxID=1351 RepID=UPI0003543961
QSITFIYTKNSTEPSKDKNQKATATGTKSPSDTDGESGAQERGKDKALSYAKSPNSQNNKDLKSLPKTGENISPIVTIAGVAIVILALFVWLFKRKQSK